MYPIAKARRPCCSLRNLSFLAATLSLLLVATASATQSVSASAPGESLAGRRKDLNTALSDIWQDHLKHSPEFASSIGDKRYDDQLPDYSVAAYNQSLERGRAFLGSLGQIDTTGMTDQEKLSKDLMVRHLIQDQEEASFKPWEMPVNQFYGIQVDLPQLVPDLTFSSAQDYDNYVSRLQKVPRAFQQITDDMSIGIEDGRVPPKFLLAEVLKEVNTIAAAKPADSPFATPLERFPAAVSAADRARIRTDVLDAITKQVVPAYQRFARFLLGRYIPNGRNDPGIWALPDGNAYYAFLVKQSTTTDLTPAEIHQIGIEEVKKDEAAMLAIAQKLGFPTLQAFEASIPNNPKLHATSADQLLDLYRHYLDQMRPKLPQLFGRLPKAQLVVKAVPAYMAKEQAAAYYDEGTPDGSRPGTVYVNTYDFQKRSLAGVESIAYHEGLPGHHLQISIAQELQGLPDFRRYTYFTAYTEGWGLYSESLGKYVGFYQDPYSDYGRLEDDIWRAIRLVVDTGVHSQHWSRQQMVDYFHAHSGIDDTNVQAEVDRYIAWPAQALGYKIGQLKFLELRARAHKALGAKFDIRAFHDEVVDSGALPLDILDQRVNAWIAKQQGN